MESFLIFTTLKKYDQLLLSFYEREYLIDLTNKRFHITQFSVSEWVRGTTPFVTIKSEYTFNTELYNQFEQSAHGINKVMPDKSSKEGVISDDPGDAAALKNFLDWDNIARGLRDMPTFFYDSNPGDKGSGPSSDFLQRWHDNKELKSISGDQDGKWKIHVEINDRATYFIDIRIITLKRAE